MDNTTCCVGMQRKRINNSLDQLRALLPYSANMKKDMASLLEQTVEYINIIHTILNEDKPACLGKVYQAYRQKTEEIESFRKSLKKLKKQKLETGSSWNQSFFPPYNGGTSSLNGMEPPGAKQFHPGMNYPTQPICSNSWSQANSFDPFTQNYHNFSAVPPAPVPIYHPPPTFQFQQPTSSIQRQCSEMPINSGDSEVVKNGNEEDQHNEASQSNENDDTNSTVASASPSQASTDEASTSGGQSQNSDIATAAIATGILRHTPSRADSGPLEFYDSIKEELNFDPNDSWLTSGSLPPLSLGQPNFVTCDSASNPCTTPSLYSHGKFSLPPFIPH